MTYDEKFSQWVWQQDVESFLVILDLSSEEYLEHNIDTETVSKEELEITFGNKIEEHFEQVIN